LISDDYMAVNFEGKVSDKENEIDTAKQDAEWNSMTVDEIHTRIFGDTAIASGFNSAQGKRKNGDIFDAKVAFPCGPIKTQWNLAVGGDAVDLVQAAARTLKAITSAVSASQPQEPVSFSLCLEHVEHWERIASRGRPAFSLNSIW
jgi:hypothetical protein